MIHASVELLFAAELFQKVPLSFALLFFAAAQRKVATRSVGTKLCNRSSLPFAALRIVVNGEWLAVNG
jgi:hypothetical protein